jgi:hypothetical protein
MAGQYFAGMVNQDRDIETEALNTVGDLADLPKCVNPSVARVELQISDW